MSRYGCDQRNSNAASSISARVRSARPILSLGSGSATRRSVVRVCDTVSQTTDSPSHNQEVRKAEVCNVAVSVRGKTGAVE